MSRAISGSCNDLAGAKLLSEPMMTQYVLLWFSHVEVTAWMCNYIPPTISMDVITHRCPDADSVLAIFFTISPGDNVMGRSFQHIKWFVFFDFDIRYVGSGDAEFKFENLCTYIGKIGVKIINKMNKQKDETRYQSSSSKLVMGNNTVMSDWARWRLKSLRLVDCLLNRLFQRRSNIILKPRVIDLCEGNPPVTDGFPSQWVSNAEMVSFWWRHYEHDSVPNSLIVASWRHTAS